MPVLTRLLIAAASFLVLLTIVQFVRQKRLEERYALLWLVAGVLMLVAPLFVTGIDDVSRALGFQYPPAFVLLVGFVALCLINLQFSVAISHLTDQNRRLAQRFALLERRLRDAEGQ
jgi:hypothetical protein